MTPEDIARLKSLMLRYEDIKRPPGVATELLSLAIEMLPSLLAAAERCGELEKYIDIWKTAERSISNAYVRLRDIIPGSHDTPHAPTREQVWAITEEAAKSLVSRATQAEARVRELEGKLRAESLETLTATGDAIDHMATISDLTTRLAAARAGLEKILGGMEPYPGDIARDTLARIGGEA